MDSFSTRILDRAGLNSPVWEAEQASMQHLHPVQFEGLNAIFNLNHLEPAKVMHRQTLNDLKFPAQYFR